jgi:hypothetical protein
VVAVADNQELYKYRERARYYFSMARDAEKSAASATSLEARAVYLQVAIGWRNLAERTEQEMSVRGG